MEQKVINKLTQPRHLPIQWQGAVLILAATIGAIFFIAQIFANLSEIDTKTVGTLMQNSAAEMSTIESISGTSIDEAYYNAQGTYLMGENKVYNASVRFQRRQALALDALGLLACVVMFIIGTQLKESRTPTK